MSFAMNCSGVIVTERPWRAMSRRTRSSGKRSMASAENGGPLLSECGSSDPLRYVFNFVPGPSKVDPADLRSATAVSTDGKDSHLRLLSWLPDLDNAFVQEARFKAVVLHGKDGHAVALEDRSASAKVGPVPMHPFVSTPKEQRDGLARVTGKLEVEIADDLELVILTPDAPSAAAVRATFEGRRVILTGAVDKIPRRLMAGGRAIAAFDSSGYQLQEFSTADSHSRTAPRLCFLGDIKGVKVLIAHHVSEYVVDFDLEPGQGPPLRPTPPGTPPTAAASGAKTGETRPRESPEDSAMRSRGVLDCRCRTTGSPRIHALWLLALLAVARRGLVRGLGDSRSW